MSVQLNIKDAETVQLARDLADATGQSVTAAIKTALRDQMARREEEVQARIARINAAVDEFRKHMPPEWVGKTSKEIMDEIYEDGLPK
jgi:antitoxin VapB